MLSMNVFVLPMLLLGLWAAHASGFARDRRSPQLSSYLPPPRPDSATCLQLPVVQNFQTNMYLGRWYEIQRFLAPFQSGSCVTADYSLLPDGSIGVRNSQILPNGTLNGILGSAISAGDPSKGSLTVSFPGQAPPSVGNYNVISTDYVNYAVVYTCSVVNIRGQETKFELSWVLSRSPIIDPAFLQRLNEWLAGQGIDTQKYQPTRQTGCQYAAVNMPSYQ